jgi:RNA polymerase sigma factor (sigma-70 family)
LEKTILYGNSKISVSYEVAEFLESDRKRQEAEKRSARRHISKSDSETVLANVPSTSQPDPTLDAVIQNLTLQKLQDVIAKLSDSERDLIMMYFFQEYTMEQIGQKFGISKVAVSKRLKKLLNRMRESMET